MQARDPTLTDDASVSRSPLAGVMARLPTSERDLRLFSGFLLWMSPTVAIVAASFVPALAPADVNFWRLVLGVPAASIAIAHLVLFPRFSAATQDRLMVVSATFGTLVCLPLLNITPATWAIEMNLLLPVTWAGYFLGRRGLAWICALATGVAISPLVYRLDTAGEISAAQVTVLIPVIWAVAIGLRFQKQGINAALERVRELGYRDPLTGLANRRALTERFETLAGQAGTGRFTLLLADLDNFKAANTHYGHLGGDHALKTVAYHLQRAAGRDHLVARIGGDEFAVLVPGAKGRARDELATFYRQAVVAANADLGLPGISADASVGSAVFPEHGSTLDDLLTQADRTMYEEKATHERASVEHATPRAMNTTWASPRRGERSAPSAPGPIGRFWRSRPLFARFAGVFAAAASLVMLLALAMPGAVVERPAPAVSLCALGVLSGVLLLASHARHRDRAHLVFDVAGLVWIGVMIYLTGGVFSPALPLMLAFAVYQAWFWSVRSIGWRLLGAGAVFASPVLYDPALARGSWEVATSVVYSGFAMTATLAACFAVNTSVLLRTRRQSRQLALTDPLTGMSNRRAFSERLEAELACAPTSSDTQLAVVMIDLDNFKQVNTELGHRSGDKLLREIADALKVVARSTDFVARVGGDEFAAVLPRAGVDGARALAERFVAAVAIASEPLARTDSVRVTASAGFALYPLHGASLDELMRAADDALMSVKRDGKAGARVSNVVMGI